MPRRARASLPSGPTDIAFMAELAAARRSSTRTFTPPIVNSMAVRSPTGPAPTITTSTRVAVFLRVFMYFIPICTKYI